MFELHKPSSTPVQGSAATEPRSTVWRRVRAELDRNGALFLLALPGMLLLIVFKYCTLPYILIAFKDFRAADGLWGSKWVGLKNFAFLFGGTGRGGLIVRNTVLYSLTFMVLGTVLALVVAVLLSKVHKSPVSGVYRLVLFLPRFVSWVIIAYIGYGFLHTKTGMLNGLLAASGREPVEWYRTPEYWPFILVASSIWTGLGSGAIMYLAGILRINPEYYEAAQIDGANEWQQAWYITLPSLMPLIIILNLLALGNIMRANFGLFYQMPMQYKNPQLIRTTDVIETYVYRALVSGQLELATAAGLYQSGVGLVLVVAANWVVRKIDPDRSLF